MRIIKHGRDHPFVVKLSEVPGFKKKLAGTGLENAELHFCACRLSKHKPFCDGSHMHVQNEEEGEIFAYGENDTRIELTEENIEKIIKGLPNEYV